ncbi:MULTISPECIES: hypothetical protein [unclassified Acidovorax]|uniref:hypothetical protein n=1 Tax=unclassified Acidovorax TaxID=2684926 RepID=UPI001C45A652|nr:MULTISPECIES: hypothetical protein [unclassified Acidovorax]MBV7427272.1 hypothetical protein [Acidovorax sp. sif0732]MBV7448396.1 hypothetical protein [Acidovorax sp. sif0715]
MIVIPVAIPAGPAVPDSGQPEPTFDAQYEAFNAWERNTAAPGMNALANATYQNALEAKARAESASASEEVALTAKTGAVASAATASAGAVTANTKAGEAAASAATAAGAAGAASASAVTANTKAGEANASAAAAQAARDAAQAYRDQAEAFATEQLIASSATNVTPGAGNKLFAIEPSRSFVTGMYLVATSVGTPTASLTGYVVSYDGNTGALMLGVDKFTGAGAHADWLIGVAAAGAADPASAIHTAAGKATPADLDELGLVDSAAAWGLKKLTWANLKAMLLAYFQGQFREKLTAARTYYVRADGNDNNTGLVNTAVGAFATIQKAIDTVAALDLGVYDVTTRCTGAFTAGVTFKTLVGAGKHIIRGAADDMTTMALTVAGGHCFHLGDAGFVGTYHLQYMKLSTTGSGNCINGAGGGGAVLYGSIDFGVCAGTHIQAGQGQYVRAMAAYTISGSAACHAGAYDAGSCRLSSFAVTLIGTPNFAVAFAVSGRAGVLLAYGASFSGAATGVRYTADSCGVIGTGAGETFLPGNALGTKTNGGQYI